MRLAAKISGIHWWYDSNSHAAEVTAGDPIFFWCGMEWPRNGGYIGYKLIQIVYMYIYFFLYWYIHTLTYIHTIPSLKLAFFGTLKQDEKGCFLFVSRSFPMFFGIPKAIAVFIVFQAVYVESISIVWQRWTMEWRYLYGGFLKWWYPTTMGFPTKNHHFGVFWGYHHLRKHPYMYSSYLKYTRISEFQLFFVRMFQSSFF